MTNPRFHALKASLLFALLLPLPILAAATDEPPPKVEKLIQQLSNSEFAERQEASRQLQKLGEPAAEALQKAATSNPDPEIRWRAAQLLAGLKGRAIHHGGRSLEDWVRRLRDRDSITREQAAVALGRLGPQATAALPDLQRALRDPELGVRWRAADALWQVDCRRGREALAVIEQVGREWQERLSALGTPADVEETEALLFATLAIVEGKPHVVAAGSNSRRTLR
jgi:HEAT repeat protein